MFDNLTSQLQRVFKNLSGEGLLTEANVGEALAQIRNALLEGDVHLAVADELVSNVRAQALGAEVMLSLSPAQQVVKILRDELVRLLGHEQAKLKFGRPPSVFFLVGLQGSGKTTTAGKLAKWLEKRGHRPLLVSTDVRRPAAREQLAIIAREVGIPYCPGEGANAVELLRHAYREANLTASDVLLVDTAGRLHIDEVLMKELAEMKAAVPPVEILFIADAMTGQDAVKSAGQFHAQLGLTGIILTKLDGDARGGAALSMRSVTGQPIKFIGVGEKYDALEAFHPDRIASRILGLGDVLSLIEKAEEAVDRRQAEALERKLRQAEFTLEDFREQLRQMRKLGPLEQIVALLPQVGPLKELSQAEVDEKKLVRVEAIINSMTPQERRNHQLINGKRRKRIARGSGTSVEEVNRVLKQYAQMRKMMRTMGEGMLKGKAGKMKLPI